MICAHEAISKVFFSPFCQARGGKWVESLVPETPSTNGHKKWINWRNEVRRTSERIESKPDLKKKDQRSHFEGEKLFIDELFAYFIKFVDAACANNLNFFSSGFNLNHYCICKHKVTNCFNPGTFTLEHLISSQFLSSLFKQEFLRNHNQATEKFYFGWCIYEYLQNLLRSLQG